MPDWKEKIEQGRQTFESKVLAPLQRKAEEWKLRDRIVAALPNDLARKLPRGFEPMAMAEWAGLALQRGGTAFYGKLLTVVLSVYFFADVTALLVENYIPEPPVSRGSSLSGENRRKFLDDYAAIWGRNLVNSQGLIPGEDQPNQVQDNGGQPVRTSLPFNLIGTLILVDEVRSIATIEDRSVQQVFPVRVEDEIPQKAKIIKVEARKVTFINTASGRREFIDMPEDPITNNARVQVGKPSVGATIEKQGNNYTVAKSEVDKALTDFNQVLTQARAVPNFENGLPAGYKLFQIVPGSIYDKLGLKNGDVISSLNGESINDPAKAFEMLGQLKGGASHMELGVKRDGRVENKVYDIK